METGVAVPGLTNGTAYAFKVTAHDEKPNESQGAVVGAYANPVLTGEVFSADSGMTKGGVSIESTQRLRGLLPNPTGSDTEYGGKAYLVINGNRIPLQVTQVPAKEAAGGGGEKANMPVVRRIADPADGTAGGMGFALSSP